ncbi:MAG: hypothetical protein HC830_08150 [Bacteroidetes bacterium]|nr:hypothetical protein [Bacteroidota bacterium]
MKQLTLLLKIFVVVAAVSCSSSNNKPAPISLHPDNPNYFLYKGKPTVIITSAEHYGAVMNADFDYAKYLATLKNDGMNYTRIFLGPYSEIGADLFGIKKNTMNPAPGKWLTPWVKDTATGRYKLDEWNEAFFSRLKSFIAEAQKNDVIVEVTFFTSYYGNHQWSNSPFNPNNNTLITDSLSFRNVNTSDNGPLMKIQEKYVRRIVQDLNAFGNLIYEIQNEPWSDNPELVEKISDVDTLVHPFSWQKIVEIANTRSLDWQTKIASIISEEEAQLPNKHLIAQNISNFRFKIENPDPQISIFNFHYAYPEAASVNLNLNKAIGLDETGFMPHNDFHYRSQAWKFMLAGGALYNNLDYSFTVGFEDGTYKIDAGTPGWGGPAYRKQLLILKNFLESFSFISMKPNNEILKVSNGSISAYQVLAEEGQQYAIYLERGNAPEIELTIPDGNYAAVWLNTLTGKEERSEEVVSTGGKARIKYQGSFEDLVIGLKIK